MIKKNFLLKSEYQQSLKEYYWQFSNNSQFTQCEYDFCGDVCVYIDKRLSEAQVDKYKIKIAVLVQPEITDKLIYDYCFKNSYIFDMIFTHHLKYVDNKKIFWYPFGSTFLLKQSLWSTYQKQKTKNISIVLSQKFWGEGHKYRQKIVKECNSIIDDIYGTGYIDIGSHSQPWLKIKSLKQYRYQIAIQSCKQYGYFTEKLIDCFLSGTIPIYWGSELSTITDFNLDGIIFLNYDKDSKEILSKCNQGCYNIKYNAINDNFEIAKKYVSYLSWIYDKYLRSVI